MDVNTYLSIEISNSFDGKVSRYGDGNKSLGKRSGWVRVSRSSRGPTEDAVVKKKRGSIKVSCTFYESKRLDGSNNVYTVSK